MKRSGHSDTKFFCGTEVEHTPAHGLQTLFVVGVQDTATIQDWIDDFASYEDSSQHIQHIFFGANHSFDPQDRPEWSRWEGMVGYFLARGYLCSLDIPITAVREFNETGLCEYRNFIPQIRVSVPYVRLWNYNTMLKIDDVDFDATNPGVWTHSLHGLMSRDSFTSWDDYSKDTVI